MRRYFFKKIFPAISKPIKKSIIFVPIMTNFRRHISLIPLLIMTLCFSACRNRYVPEEIMAFENNFNNDSQQLDHLAKMADSCTKFYANDPIFLEKKSQIFYQKGINHHKNGEYIEATRTFITSCLTQRSLVALKKLPSNDDFHYLGQIYEQLGDVYGDVNSLKPTSHFYDDALTQYEKASRQHEVIDMLLKIGDLYQHNHISNIALLNYETAEGKKNLTEQQSDIIQIKKGIALYDIFDMESADSIYRRISTKSPQFIEFKYFTACYFYNRNEYGKALPYLLKCFEDGDQNMKLYAAEMLASVYFSLNDHARELEYAQYQAKAQSAEARLTPVRVEMEALYESFLEDSNPNKPENTGNLKRFNWILIVTVIILIMVVVILNVIFKRHKKDKEQIIDDISKKLEEATSQENAPHSFDENYNDFVQTAIYLDIKASLEGKQIFIKTVRDYPRLALSKTKLVTLTTTFNESFPNLTHTLSEMYPELTPADFRFIILSVMGFSDLEIAVLLKQTYGSANKRSNRIKDILHTEEELEHYIPNFLRTVRY